MAAADMEQMLGMQGAAPAPTQPMMAPASADMMGGIGSLPMTEEEPTMPDGGLASAIDRLQSFGRSGDELIAHMTPGELVVPGDILKQNPEVQEMIFAEMRLAGIEDPERYIVGSEANSINPETGLPEFFFKKIFKGVKKAVKSVAKVVKKVAPIVLPIALAMTPLGPIYGAALGSGIGTLAQGGDLKDAFKSALISGALGGISAGVSSKLGGGTFTGGVSDAFGNAGARFAQTGRALSAGKPFQSFVDPTQAAQAATTGPQGTPVPDTTVDTSTVQDVTQATEMATSASGRPVTVDQTLDTIRSGSQPNNFSEGFFDNRQATPFEQEILKAKRAVSPEAGTFSYAPDRSINFDQFTQPTGAPPRTTLQTAGDYMFRGGQNPAEIAAAQEAAGQAYLASTPANLQTAANFEAAKAAAGPSLLERFGPSVAAGTAAAYGAGFFDTPPPPEPYDAFEGQTRYFDMTPEERAQYRIADLSSGPDYRDPYITESPYQLQNPRFQPMPFYQPVRYAAQGGEMSPDYFPRRMGAIAGPGTETSDDVPAMLSDGEFVMTAKAVRGAGNGSRERGIKTMYDMMSQFERSVA